MPATSTGKRTYAAVAKAAVATPYAFFAVVTVLYLILSLFSHPCGHPPKSKVIKSFNLINDEAVERYILIAAITIDPSYHLY